MSLIQEALKEGARLSPACATIGISLRTYQRWKAGNHSDRRKGAKKHIPRKLTAEERGEIRALCCDHEFKDENPYEIVITLLERGNYIASIDQVLSFSFLKSFFVVESFMSMFSFS
jgi:putative transposase